MKSCLLQVAISAFLFAAVIPGAQTPAAGGHENNDSPGLVARLPARGACCYGAGACELQLESDCGGLWLGANTSCADCPLLHCQGGTPEAEPWCFDGYIDRTNGGCDSSPPVFGAIQAGESICGESGTYEGYHGPARDTDWYQINAAWASWMRVTVQAEFHVQVLIIAAGGGPYACEDYEIVAALSGAPFEEGRLEICRAPGNYFLWFGPCYFGQVPCGASYVATLECGSCDGGGACCLADGGCEMLWWHECADAGGAWLGASEQCEVVECPALMVGDCNCDGHVDALDISPFVRFLTDPPGYVLEGCYRQSADCNGDGSVDALDIDPFVRILVG